MNTTAPRFNPFPGLRSFRSDEDHLFFGREVQTVELVSRLQLHRFIAVVGSSGGGKSSLVRCGLLSRLQGGGMSGAGAHWEIAVMHPGGDPLRHLAEGLLDAGLYDRAAEDAVPQLLATLGRSQFGLVEAVRQAALPAGTNFLLVVDQFEEIFRYDEAGAAESERANDFIAMLREACAQNGVAVYVVVTMRSDFIGDCSRFDGLAEAVNRGEYLIPRLSREQFKSAIEGPIRVAGGRIAPRLLQRLLNDVGEEQDQLPCLQHALMRTWRVSQGRSGADALDLEDYAQVGKMSQALSLHADEVYAALATDRQRELCAAMFKALTVEGSEKRGIRRPRRLQTLCRILEVEKVELRPVVDAFRQPEVSFVLPGTDVELRDTTVIDLSHESLMRVWSRLRAWVDEEAQSVGIFRRLSESAALWREGRTGLCRDPELAIARAWRQTNRPNAAWTEQYAGNFEEAMAYLQASTDAAEAELREREQRARAVATRRTRRLRWLVGGLASMVVALCIAGVYGLHARSVANQRSSVTDAAFANQLLAQGRFPEGLAYLVRAARRDPHNPTLAPRLASLLTSRNVTLPEGAPLKFSSRILDLHFSTDGKRFLVICEDGKLAFVDAATGEQTQIKLPASVSSRLLFGWVGPRVAIGGSDGVVRVVNIDSAVIEREFRFEQKVVQLVVRDTPAANVWMRLEDSSIVLAEAATGQSKSLPFKHDWLGNFAVTADGRWAAVGGGRAVAIWDLVAGAQTATCPLPGFIRGCAFVREGHAPLLLIASVVAQGAQTVGFRLYAVPDGHAVTEMEQIDRLATNQANPLILRSPDERYFGIGHISETPLYRIAEGPRPGTFLTPKVTLARFARFFTPDSRMLLGPMAEGKVQIWEVESGKPLFAPLDAGGIVTAITFDSASTVAITTASGGTVRVWNLKTGKLLAEPTQQQQSAVVAAISPGGIQFVTGTVGGLVHRARVDSGRAQPLPVRFVNDLQGRTLVTLPGSPTRLARVTVDRVHLIDAVSGRETSSFALPEPYLAAQAGRGVRDDFKVMVVMTQTSNKMQAWWLDPVAGVTQVVDLKDAPLGQGYVTFSAQGDLMARVLPSEPRKVQLWNLKTGHSVATLSVASLLSSAVGRPIDFSPDGTQFAAGGADGIVKVWEIATGKLVHSLPPVRDVQIRVVQFSPDGRLILATNSWDECQLWDARTGARVGAVINHGLLARFSRDAKLIINGSGDGTAQVWDARTGAPVGERLRHGSGLRFVMFSADGNRVLTGSEDSTARLWDARTGQPISEPFEHEARVMGGGLSPDGRFALTEAMFSRWGSTAAVWLWSLPPSSEGAPVPEWLLDLATICAGARLNEDGQLVDAADAGAKLEDVRHTLDALPADAPFADWGRWVLADRATRSIAPGFTITPREAEEQVAKTAAEILKAQQLAPETPAAPTAPAENATP